MQRNQVPIIILRNQIPIILRPLMKCSSNVESSNIYFQESILQLWNYCSIGDWSLIISGDLWSLLSINCLLKDGWALKVFLSACSPWSFAYKKVPFLWPMKTVHFTIFNNQYISKN